MMRFTKTSWVVLAVSTLSRHATHHPRWGVSADRFRREKRASWAEPLLRSIAQDSLEEKKMRSFAIPIMQQNVKLSRYCTYDGCS